MSEQHKHPDPEETPPRAPNPLIPLAIGFAIIIIFVIIIFITVSPALAP